MTNREDEEKTLTAPQLQTLKDLHMKIKGTPRSLLVLTTQASVRFWMKVEKTETCWLWTAATNSVGYGTFGVGGTMQYAHRLAYVDRHGPIPDGCQIDHLCRRRHCVNPCHLEAVSVRENLLRGVGASAVNARKPSCASGHRFTTQNTYLLHGTRYCRRCRTIRHRQWVRDHPEAVSRYGKAHYAKYTDRVKAKHRAYYLANRQAILATGRARRELDDGLSALA